MKTVIDNVDLTSFDAIENVWRESREKLSQSELITQVVKKFNTYKHWQARKAVLYYLVSYSRKYPQLVDLAIGALKDNSIKVREEACALLAFSLNEKATIALEAAKKKDAELASSADAALQAIKHKDHHRFLNRDLSFPVKILWRVTEVK